jgi:hypothetical protein
MNGMAAIINLWLSETPEITFSLRLKVPLSTDRNLESGMGTIAD